MEDVDQVYFELRNLLEEAVKEKRAEGILLSGGLDTSIIAFLAKKYVPDLKAFTISLKGYDVDLSYARIVASELELEHKIYLFSEDEFWQAAASLKGFRDDCQGLKEPVGLSVLVPTYLIMNCAKEQVDSIYTGIGADELFLGYPAMISTVECLASFEDELGSNLGNRLFLDVLNFCDVEYQDKIGEILSLDVVSPYLNPQVREYALKLDIKYKVRGQGGNLWGKWILRKAFENDLPQEVVWRRKVPMERGTGSYKFIDAWEIKEAF